MNDDDAPLSRADLIILVSWQAQDYSGSPYAQGNYRIITRDVGDTIGVGLYSADGSQLIHAFYAHTRYFDSAEDTTRKLVLATVERIRRNHGARYVTEKFPELFPVIVAEQAYRPLDPEELKG